MKGWCFFIKISVVLCTYNGQEFVEKQIESILKQKRCIDELIIQDDNSHDQTFKLVNDIMKLAPEQVCVRLFKNKENMGYIKNFESALNKATGDIIILSDQDDWWYPNKAAEIEKAFKENPGINFVFSNGDVVDQNLKELNYTLLESKNIKSKEIEKIKKGELFNYLLRYNIVTGATMAISREVLKGVVPFPNDWVHDAWLSIVGAEKRKYYFIDQSLIKYRIHEKNNIGVSKNILEEFQKFKRNLSEPTARPFQSLYDYAKGHFLEENKSLVEKKYEFYKKREIYSRNFLKRGCEIFINFQKGYYKKYANGYKSLGKDLFFYERKE